MDFNGWWNSGGTTDLKLMKSRRLKNEKNGYGRIVSLDVMVSRSKISRWRLLLWRKLNIKDKKKIFDCTSNLDHVVPSYNPRTYAQNFDQGSMSSDPDSQSRSFSARFAVPARIFHNSKFVG